MTEDLVKRLREHAGTMDLADAPGWSKANREAADLIERLTIPQAGDAAKALDCLDVLVEAWVHGREVSDEEGRRATAALMLLNRTLSAAPNTCKMGAEVVSNRHASPNDGSIETGCAHQLARQKQHTPYGSGDERPGSEQSGGETREEGEGSKNLIGRAAALSAAPNAGLIEALRPFAQIVEARDRDALSQGFKISHSAISAPYALFDRARQLVAALDTVRGG